MSYDIKIRPVTTEDFERLRQLYLQIDTQHWKAAPHIFKPPNENARPRKELEKLLTDPKRLVCVAVIDDKICGYLLGKLIEFETFVHQPATIAHISEIIVEEQQFGRGIGQALMTHAKQWAAEQQATKINLNVYAFNKRAIRFYEKEGFVTERLTMLLDLNTEVRMQNAEQF